MDAVDMDTVEDSHDDTIEETVPEVCRVCLLGHMIMRDLFVENSVSSLSAKAMSFASVKMVPDDGLPAQVCCDCADKLEAAYEFKLQVEQADNVLRQRYDGLNIKEELFFNEVEVHLEAERGDDVHSLNVDARYQATVDSLNGVDADGEKSGLLKDHLALYEVEKLAKEQSALEEHKHPQVLDEETGVSAMLEANEGHAHYLDESEGTVIELDDCNDVDYPESVKAQEIQDAEGITAEEHNYIMQQGYTLTRNEGEELVSQESVDSVNNESVNYLAMMEDEMRIKEDHQHRDETINTVESEQQEQEDTEKMEISPNETRRSKRKLTKRRRTSDEDNYFENLNLSSRLKRTQSQEKSEKLYFLCYLCDKRFVSKEILKEHMHSHEEVRRALSLKKQEKCDKSVNSPTKSPVASTSTSPPIPNNNLSSGKKANKCPYCGKEYLYVISFNKHLRQHEKSKGFDSKDSSFSQEDSGRDEAKDSSHYYESLDYDETGKSTDMNNRINSNENDSAVDENIEDEQHFGMEVEAGNSSSKKLRRRSMRNDVASYSCEKCHQSFANKVSLLEHSSEHFSIFKCSTCEREFDELEKLRKHRTEHVVEGVLSQHDLEDNVYESEFDAKMHGNDVNEIYKTEDFEENSQLENCEQRDDDEDDDRDHNIDTENSWHLEVEGEDEDHEEVRDISGNWTESKNYKCPHCTITCSSKKSFIQHVEYHEEASQQICKLCKAEFTSKEELQRHVEQEYACKTKIFKCTDCSKIFGNELTLRNHLFATDHKTIMHGEPYDPNKRIKRVAAKAAQKIIDKIKTEDDLEDSEDEEKLNNSDDQEEHLDSSDTKINNLRWDRQDVKTEDTSPRKMQVQRNRRRHNYECETCGRKCRSKQSLTKHVLQHRAKEERIDMADGSDNSRRNNSGQTTERSGTLNNQQQISRTTIFKGEERTEDEEENDDNSDFESGLDWPVDSHECPTCKKKYSTKKSLLRHQLLHQKPNFECDICSVKFYRKDKLKSHYDKCSEKNPDQVRKCNICGDTFENNDILKEHRSRHVDEGLLTEEDLREIEPGMDERKESTKVARKRRTDIVGLECTECNKRYTSRKGLLRHIQVHEGKKYLCDICPKKFYRREHLKIHVAKHNMIKPYKCPRCTKRFIKEEQLSSHLSKHDRTFKKPKETDTSKRFLCEICSKSFTQSTTLIAHLRAHNGIKPYVCEVCARPFTTNAYLKMHMRTHTQERPYTCQHCSRAFARADTLANHLTSHTGEAKYHCKYCPKNFRRLKSLKEHVFIHTGQRPYACPTCDRRFNNNGSRYAHSKRCKQNHLQNSNRPTNAPLDNPILQENLVHNQLVQPIRLHQLTTTHELIPGHEEQQQIQLVKSQSIKAITIARTTDDLNGSQMLQHQEILMPLILPLTVTLTDPDEEVILPEGTKIYTTA